MIVIEQRSQYTHAYGHLRTSIIVLLLTAWLSNKLYNINVRYIHNTSSRCFPAAITPSGAPMIGQSFSLLCTVTETDSLQLTISYYWFRGQLPLTTNSGLLTFDTLFLSDAGLYRCEVTVSSDGHQITVNSSYDIDFKSKQFLWVQYIILS